MIVVALIAISMIAILVYIAWLTDPKQPPLFGKYYILHEDVKNPENGFAFFGPFDKSEIEDRINDAYADLIIQCGDVDVVKMTSTQAARYYINPREFWMKELGELLALD